MTIGIYCIKHIDSGKRYIGKSVSIERRLAQHKYFLRKPERSLKATNRYLYAAVQKYGWDAFETSIVESFDVVDNDLISERELYWIDYFDSCDKGYNLRRDSSTGMITHAKTRKLQSKKQSGQGNGNFGYRWSEEMKARMSIVKKKQHSSGEIYNDEWRMKLGLRSKNFWENNPDKKKQMAKKVSDKKKKYKFHQLNEDGELLKEWESIEEIISANPTWKWQNIYSVCNGYKKRIYGFKWEKIPK